MRRLMPAATLLLAACASAHVSAAEPATAMEAWVRIEIPAGSFTKYEYDTADGRLVVDRFLPDPAVYPANYGAIPDSLAGDGDPLDALVITRAPIVPGAYIRVRVIGLLRVTDDGAQDDKIIAVPASSVDPHYEAVRTIGDLSPAQQSQIELFFRTYKLAPDGTSPIVLGGFGDAGEAGAMIGAALAAGSGSPR